MKKRIAVAVSANSNAAANRAARPQVNGGSGGALPLPAVH